MSSKFSKGDKNIVENDSREVHDVKLFADAIDVV